MNYKKTSITIENTPYSKELYEAAPDMYEACLSALGALSTVEATNMTNVAMENLRQALRKAEGRTDRG